jgi:hypothetical protein
MPRVEAIYRQRWHVTIERMIKDAWPDVYLSGRGMITTDTVTAIYEPESREPISVYVSGRLPAGQNTGVRANIPYTHNVPEWVQSLLVLAPPPPWEKHHEPLAG